MGNKRHEYKSIIAILLLSGKRIGKDIRTVTLNDNKIDPNELVDRLQLLEASRQAGHNAHNNEILSIIEELRSNVKPILLQIKLRDTEHSVNIEMPIIKFETSLGKSGVEPYHQWSGLLKNIVCDNALCMDATDFDAKSRKIRRVALPVDDGDVANKR